MKKFLLLFIIFLPCSLFSGGEPKSDSEGLADTVVHTSPGPETGASDDGSTSAEAARSDTEEPASDALAFAPDLPGPKGRFKFKEDEPIQQTLSPHEQLANFLEHNITDEPLTDHQLKTLRELLPDPNNLSDEITIAHLRTILIALKTLEVQMDRQTYKSSKEREVQIKLYRQLIAQLLNNKEEAKRSLHRLYDDISDEEDETEGDEHTPEKQLTYYYECSKRLHPRRKKNNAEIEGLAEKRNAAHQVHKNLIEQQRELEAQLARLHEQIKVNEEDQRKTQETIASIKRANILFKRRHGKNKQFIEREKERLERAIQEKEEAINKIKEEERSPEVGKTEQAKNQQKKLHAEKAKLAQELITVTKLFKDIDKIRERLPGLARLKESVGKYIGMEREKVE